MSVFNKTGQRGVPTKSFGTQGQQVEKWYCPGQNGTSGHFTIYILWKGLEFNPGM